MAFGGGDIYVCARVNSQGLLHVTGCCQRPGPGDSQHLQRAPGVPHLLADIRHHGRPDVRRKILQGEDEQAFEILLACLA